jgi:hypothetical protein
MRERAFTVRTFKQVVSADVPLCQMADLFAGLGCYTREKAAAILRGVRAAGGQGSLFQPIENAESSKTDRERLNVILHLDKRCKEGRFGLSLRSSGYFRSLGSPGPINFWHYQPQHEGDRAPMLRNESAWPHRRFHDVTRPASKS